MLPTQVETEICTRQVKHVAVRVKRIGRFVFCRAAVPISITFPRTVKPVAVRGVVIATVPVSLICGVLHADDVSDPVIGVLLLVNAQRLLSDGETNFFWVWLVLRCIRWMKCLTTRRHY